MHTLSLFQMIGIAGFALYLFTYISLQWGRIVGTSQTYSTLSVIAATMVLVSLMENFNVAAALIQITWIVIGICAIVARMSRASRRNQSAFTLFSQQNRVRRPYHERQEPTFRQSVASNSFVLMQ